jgi:hypothetical protein
LVLLAFLGDWIVPELSEYFNVKYARKGTTRFEDYRSPGLTGRHKQEQNISFEQRTVLNLLAFRDSE